MVRLKFDVTMHAHKILEPGEKPETKLTEIKFSKTSDGVMMKVEENFYFLSREIFNRALPEILRYLI